MASCGTASRIDLDLISQFQLIMICCSPTVHLRWPHMQCVRDWQSHGKVLLIQPMFKECAMQYSFLTGMNFAQHEYWQSLETLVVSQLQNEKKSHALTSYNPVCLQACWNNCKLYTKSSWSKPLHLYYQPCTAAVHLLASCSKLCSAFHQHASPSTSHAPLTCKPVHLLFYCSKESQLMVDFKICACIHAQIL